MAGPAAPTADQRERLLQKLATRLDSNGRLRLVSSGTRSQLRNRDEVTERLRDVVAAALAAAQEAKADQAQLGRRRRPGSKPSAGRAATKRERRAPRHED